MTTNSSPTSLRRRRSTAKPGDVVTVDLSLTPENGYVPESLFDTQGTITFVLGWGNYLPGLHSLLEGTTVGEKIKDVSLDAGWGERRPELILTVPKSKLQHVKQLNSIQKGAKLHLKGDVVVSVVDVQEDSITVDANPPLAGASYLCNATVRGIAPNPLSTGKSKYQVATFALGCFWGAELAFMRLPGVVGTKSGYTQGVTRDPTYEQVCEGSTKHREAVLVAYDPDQVSYPRLMEVALERLAETTTHFMTNMFEEDDDSEQYKNGFYFHTPQQKEQATEELKRDNRHRIELLEATTFYDAEEYHQQYLLKGGQSARKGAKETIRCFG